MKQSPSLKKHVTAPHGSTLLTVTVIYQRALPSAFIAPISIKSETCDAALVKLGSYHQSSISHDEPFGYCQVIHRDFNNDLQESEAQIIDEGNTVSNQYKLEGLQLFQTDSGAPIFKNNQFIGIAIYQDENNITFIPISQMSEILNQITESTPSHHLRPVGPGSINDNGELFDDGSGEYLTYKNLEDIREAVKKTIEPIKLSHQTLIEVDDYFKNNTRIFKGHFVENNENDQFNEFFNNFMNKIASISDTHVNDYKNEITKGIKQLLNKPLEITDCPYSFKIDSKTFYLSSHTGGHVSGYWEGYNSGRNGEVFNRNLVSVDNIALIIETTRIMLDEINQLNSKITKHYTVGYQGSVIEGNSNKLNAYHYVTVQVTRQSDDKFVIHAYPNKRELNLIEKNITKPTYEHAPTRN